MLKRNSAFLICTFRWQENLVNPKKLVSLANHKQEKWKAPLPEFIEDLYFKRFKKDRPDTLIKPSAGK
jgi:hypothetical protein